MSIFKVVKIRNDFAKVAGVTVQDVADSLRAEAEGIMTASKTLYVPVKTGALKNSGTVLKPTFTGDKVEVVLGYGTGTKVGLDKNGGDVTYAALVHEYPKSYGQGRNKYLTTPVAVATKNMASRIAKDLKKRLNNRKIP
jgi:hypothetical protein